MTLPATRHLVIIHFCSHKAALHAKVAGSPSTENIPGTQDCRAHHGKLEWCRCKLHWICPKEYWRLRAHCCANRTGCRLARLSLGCQDQAEVGQHRGGDGRASGHICRARRKRAEEDDQDGDDMASGGDSNAPIPDGDEDDGERNGLESSNSMTVAVDGWVWWVGGGELLKVVTFCPLPNTHPCLRCVQMMFATHSFRAVFTHD
jgi:hypothetical protein